jgi:hypothetical protein
MGQTSRRSVGRLCISVLAAVLVQLPVLTILVEGLTVSQFRAQP